MREAFIILVIEEDQEGLASIKSACNTLKTKGVELSITIAPSLAAAHEILQTDAVFDIIIADLDLPESQGIETIKSLQEAALTTPLIATSTFLQKESIRILFRLGAQDYLPKNELDPLHLLRVIYSAV